MNEGSAFSSLSAKASEADYQTWTQQIFNRYHKPNLAAQVLQKYPASNFAETKYGTAAFWASAAAVGDYAMSCAARRTARWITGSGEGTPPVYLYFFKHKLSMVGLVEAVSKKPLGVFHGSELMLVFDTKIVLTKAEKALATQTVALWTSFAQHGKPECSGVIEWPAYSNKTDQNLVLDIPIGVESGLKDDLCKFWDDVGPLT